MQLGDIVHLFSLSGDLEFASSAASKDGKRRQAFLEYRCDAAAPLSAYQLIMIPLMMLHAPTAGRQHGGGAHAALAMSRLEVTLDGMTLKILVRLVVALYMTRAHGARR